MYSQDMKDLISKLLVKDEKKRPQVLEILRMPFVSKHMHQFVQDQSTCTDFHLTAPKGLQPDFVNKLKQKDESELTPADRMRIRKEQRDLAEFENLKAAAEAAQVNRTLGKQLELNQFHQGETTGLLTNGHQANMGIQPMGTIRGAESTMGSDFDCNNRTMGSSVGNAKESTMRRDVRDSMQDQQIRTEYDSRPWVPK